MAYVKAKFHQRSLFAWKNCAISCAAGTVIGLLSIALSEKGVVAGFFSSPGAFLADCTGLGAHDLDGLLLYFLGNIGFYSFVVFAVLAAVHRLARAIER